LKLRYAQQHEPANDWMPLHPDFYEFVNEDEDGYFIKDKAGNRWRVEMKEEMSL
jgi:hypothetical protein